MSERPDSMASTYPARGESDPGHSPLVREGWRFDFFQAVWLLERALPKAEPVGARGPAEREAIQFRPHVSMGFPATDVRRIAQIPRERGAAPQFQVDVTFLGLYGVATPLPLHFAIDVLRSVVQRPDATPPAEGAAATDPTFGGSPTRDFMDVLHHRLISFFYRCWTKYRYDVAFGAGQRDVVTGYLRWLIGTSPSMDEAVLGVEPLRLLRYAGVFTQHPRSATTLEGLLYDFGGIPAAVRQFIGRWVALGTADLNRMGLANARLGMDLTVGEQVYDLSGTFRIAFGPMDWASYATFLPDGERFGRARKLVRLYCTDPLSFSFEMRLLPAQVPQTQLSSDDEAGRLGFTSWVRTKEMAETSVVFEAA